MSADQKLVLTQTVEMPVDAVTYALTNGPVLTQWLCNSARVNGREGGQIYLSWQDGYYACGEFTTLAENETVAFTWQGRGEPKATDVSISLSEKDGATHIELTHAGLGEGEAWTETRQELEKGWQTSLANLKSVLETGLDRRIYDQPFLGILITGTVSAEEMAELNIPAEGGIRISGAMEGTGAEAIGLQNGDIITDMGGSPTTDLQSLRAALQPYKAGDNIKVTYYREGEKQTDLMTLSERPAPNVPETAAAFSEALADEYKQLDRELDELLAGVSETEASFRPEPDAWNVKEILAHLIGSERGTQIGVASRITDGVLRGFPNNPPAWIKSITAVYPTVEELTAELKRAEVETVALVANLPSELVARKATYLGIGNNLLFFTPFHTRSHFDEMRQLIEAAQVAEPVPV